MVSFTISSVAEDKDKSALNELLLENYAVILKKFAAAGGPAVYIPEDLLASFWPNLHKFLPPTGRLFLVKDSREMLVGCAILQQARPDATELKWLYVRPEASGHGLGGALVDVRLNAARDMGWKTLLVNAVGGIRTC